VIYGITLNVPHCCIIVLVLLQWKLSFSEEGHCTIHWWIIIWDDVILAIEGVIQWTKIKKYNGAWYFSQYRDWAVGWMVWELVLYFWQALGIYCCSRESGLVSSHWATFLVGTSVLLLGCEAEYLPVSSDELRKLGSYTYSVWLGAEGSTVVLYLEMNKSNWINGCFKSKTTKCSI
jgi:hypothetical protein